MDFKDFHTGKDDISRRLDKVIRIFAADLSLGEIYKAIRKGLIKVNNRKTKSDYRIQENDTISIASFLINKADSKGPHLDSPSPTKNNLKMPEIVFENDAILLLNKPYDINVHGDDNSLDKIVTQYYNSKPHSQNLSFKPGPIHRLDRKTTGLVAFSMNLEGAKWFSENIKSHTIQKKYWGLAEGTLESQEIWKDNISKADASGSPKSFHTVVATGFNEDDTQESKTEGQLAETIATPLARGAYRGHPVTLIEYNIKTGRKHQIRAQSGRHGHPLLGDVTYGGQKPAPGNQQIYLTAKELTFPKDNPLTLPGKLKISLPAPFKSILNSCGIEISDV